jgi:hypothetical protein
VVPWTHDTTASAATTTSSSSTTATTMLWQCRLPDERRATRANLSAAKQFTQMREAWTITSHYTQC